MKLINCIQKIILKTKFNHIYFQKKLEVRNACIFYLLQIF